MRYLLDTNILSELVKPAPDPPVIAWVKAVGSLELAISVLTLGELAHGVMRHPDARRRKRLERWVAEEVPKQFAGRLLPVTDEVALAWGALMATARSAGRTLPAIDGLLLATARVAGLTLVTRNLRDCVGHGVEVMSPWAT